MEADRGWVALGAVYGALAVGAAAGAAHLGSSPALLSAVQMHGWHALALVACGLWGARGGWLRHAAGTAFAVGVLLFSGSIYAGAFGVRVGPVAPVGGTLLMLGWLALAVSALRRRT